MNINHPTWEWEKKESEQREWAESAVRANERGERPSKNAVIRVFVMDFKFKWYSLIANLKKGFTSEVWLMATLMFAEMKNPLILKTPNSHKNETPSPTVDPENRQDDFYITVSFSSVMYSPHM